MNKKILINIKLFAFILLIAIFTGSCIDDNFDFDRLSLHTENEGMWEVPGVVHTTFKIGDMINQLDTVGLVSSDSEGLIILTYSDTAYTAIAEDVIEFPDQTYDTIFNKQDFDLAGGFTDNTVTMQKSDVDFLFSTYGSQILDSILLKSALMDVSVTSSFEYEGVLTITFPELKKNGVPYRKMINIDNNTGNFTFNNTYNELDGYILDFTNTADINTFFVTYNLQLQKGTGAGTVEATDICDIEIDFREIKYDYVWGYVGQQSISIPEKEINIDFFNAFDNGTFELRDPRIKVKINNSYGLEIGVFMPTLQMRVDDDNTWVDITGEDIPTSDNPWLISAPEDNFPNNPIIESTIFNISGLASNLGELVSRLPDRIKYGEKVILNPEGDNTAFNFMDDPSLVEAILTFEIPLWGRTDGITFTDTLDMDLKNIADEIHRIDYLDMTLKFGNGLPHNIGMKAYLMDSLYNIVDSLPNSNDGVTLDGNQWWILESGIIGADGVINQQENKTISEHVIRLEGEGVDVIEDVKYMQIEARYITTDGTTATPPFVKYFDFYEMDIDVSIVVKLNINENF